MTTTSFSTSTIGWVALGTGIAVIFAVLFLILMFTVNIFFGTINDVLNIIIGISSAVLAWMLYAVLHAKSPEMSQIALALAILGAIISLVGSVLVIYGFTDFFLAGLYSELGYALIGLWLVVFCYSMQRSNTLPHTLILFGFVAGAFMALGLIGIPGILARTDSMVSLPWYLYVALFGWLGTYVLYPIWTIWLGRNLLSKEYVLLH
jgi:uncharacterized membrane protein YeaQ/YmgE (transglycosylase-associated protein family)